MIEASGAGLMVRNGGTFNRYTDYFADAVPDNTWTFEALFGWEWPARPRVNTRLSFSLPAEVAILALSRAAVRDHHRRIADELVDLIACRARDLFDWTLDARRRELLAGRCARRLAVYPLRQRQVEARFARVRPRVYLIEAGCYGQMAVLNATARQHGVIAAEVQHGWTSSGHDAYNVAPLLAHSAAYRRTQPHWFLGYGAWGNRLFNAPVERAAIGNPHRTAVLARLPSRERPRDEILVLGDGSDADGHIRFCRELAALVPRPLRVVFRPHPLERERMTRAAPATEPVRLDFEPDIYDSMHRTHALIAEASTGLFEAAGIVDRVFVWETATSRLWLPEHPFASFRGAEDLVAALADPSAGRISLGDAEQIWASDWQTNFSRFLESVDTKG
jgi:hypothetical protein